MWAHYQVQIRNLIVELAIQTIKVNDLWTFEVEHKLSMMDTFTGMTFENLICTYASWTPVYIIILNQVYQGDNMTWANIKATWGNNPCPLAKLYKLTPNLLFYFATLIKDSPLSLSDSGLQDQHQCDAH